MYHTRYYTLRLSDMYIAGIYGYCKTCRSKCETNPDVKTSFE